MAAQPLIILPDSPPATPGRQASPVAGSSTSKLPASRPPSPPLTPGLDRVASSPMAHWQDWGLDRPLSTLLREATALAHEKIQRSPVVDLLVRGEIPLQLHVRYLVMLFHVYSTLEQALALHADDPVLAAVSNHALLSRADVIANDIILFTGDHQWRASEAARDPALLASPELNDYLDRLHALSDDSIYATRKDAVYAPARPVAHLLLAHSYVRYMGDLSGGQTIANAVESAYGLEAGSMSFYRFGKLDALDEIAGPSEMKRIKAWYRQGMDAGGAHLDELQKAEMMQEANFAFELNVRLFSSFAALLDLGAVPDSPVKLALPTARDAHSRASTYSAGLSLRKAVDELRPTTERRPSCPFDFTTSAAIAGAVVVKASPVKQPAVVFAALALAFAVVLALRVSS